MELFDVGSIGASGSDRREDGVLCHHSRGASQYKAPAFEQVSQFQQGVLIIPVAVDNHCQGRCVRTGELAQQLGTEFRQPSGKDRQAENNQFIRAESAGDRRVMQQICVIHRQTEALTQGFGGFPCGTGGTEMHLGDLFDFHTNTSLM